MPRLLWKLLITLWLKNTTNYKENKLHSTNHPDPALLSKVLHGPELNKSWFDARPNGDVEQYGIAGGDEIETYKLGLIRFSDSLPAICYAHGISLETLQQKFPEVYSAKYHYNQIKGPSWPTYENLVLKNYNNVPKEILEEIFDQSQWSWNDIEKTEKDYYEGHHNQYFSNLTIYNQINFINEYLLRRPEKVLDVGGGRGEIANLFKKIGVDCVSLEPGQYSEVLYDYTGKLFFGKEFVSSNPTCSDLKTFIENTDISQFDTIIFSQSIEHIVESEFWEFWNQLKDKFNGLVIIVGCIFYHPIPVAGAQHIFEINDEVYDRLVNDSKQCVYRNHSHLVLEL
jgi:2-polyprenyl-3-methyl-5-hydroxy-6-metoxy-1,4-benzoquinol methylase